MKSFTPFLIFLLLTTYTINGQQTIKADFGSYTPEVSPKNQCVSDVERTTIKKNLKTSRAALVTQGILTEEKTMTNIVLFDWPLQTANGYPFSKAWSVTNYVDQDPNATGAQYGASNLDYDCGNRTYDTSSGYNHQGIDIATWPFSWYLYENDFVEVIAAADGIIIGKDDGQADDHCSCSGTWNAVYVEHADGSVAWYGHLKNNSLTTKTVGATVAKGEYLGVVASSGCSTGPHLHLEIYDSNNNLIDPYSGACNSMNNNSWWSNQESYFEPTLNAVLTHSAPPSYGCHNVEAPNLENVFSPGETVYVGAYYRDIQIDDITNYRIKKPDNSVWQTWSGTSTNQYINSSFLYSWTLPSNGPFGTWTFEATYGSQTLTHEFQYESLLPVDLLDFQAEIQHHQVVLAWRTASELNNAGFEVERSSDGSNWSIIAFIDGLGNSENVHQYNYIDKHPASMTNYYRLKQIDLDGKFEYSKTISIDINGQHAPIIVYPNPVDDILTIDYPTEMNLLMRLYSHTGQLLARFENERKLNVSTLENGIYFLEFENRHTGEVSIEQIIHLK